MPPSTTSQQTGRLSRSAKAAQADNIRVYCRVRPLSKEEESKAATKDLCVAFPSRLDDKLSLSCTTTHSSVNAGPGSPVAATASSMGPSGSPNDTHNFTFSEVFRPLATQSDVFADAGLPSVKDVMAGYNSTIFVYGQTGSGKTHTMFGRVHHHASSHLSVFGKLVKRKSSTNVNGTSVLGGGASASSDVNFFALRATEGLEADEEVFSPALPTFSQEDNERPYGDGVGRDRRGSADSTFTGTSATRTSPPDTFRSTSGAIPTSASDQTSGIVPRAVREIFTHIYTAPVTTEFEIRIFFVEVYMEQVRDLLNPDGAKAKLQVREDVAGRRFYVEDCEMPFVTSPSEIMHMVQAGLKRRATSATAMNETSSRSHCILNITVKSTDRKLHESRVGKLFLVDLAGSEKVSKTQSSGMRLEEAKLINRSLTSLSQVISNLAEGHRHVPYRDSVLTKILKDSLGGNARTSLIICCSPSVYNAAETLSTLRFGARAKTIKNRAVINRQYTVEELETMLRVARQEIAELQKRLVQQRQTPQGKVTASSSSASAASAGAETQRPDGSSPPHAVRRLDVADTHNDGDENEEADGDNRSVADEDGDATGALEDAEDELVLVSLRQRSREKMQLNDLLAELGMAKDAVKSADEANAALSEERETMRQRATCLEEECALWQTAYQGVRQRLAHRQQQLQERNATITTQQNEIRALISQMEEWLEPLRVATAAVAETTGEHRFDKSVPRPRRRTLIALESPVATGPSSTSKRVAGADTSEVVLFPSSGQNSGPTTTSQQTSPTTARAPCQAGEFALSPSARANQAALERAAASMDGTQRMPNSVESPGMLSIPPSAANGLGGSPPPNTSPRMPAPLQLSPLAATNEEQETVMTDGADEAGEAERAALSEAAAARIVELERELAVTQREFDAIRQNYAATTLELQLSQKKLLIRQNRIESLKMSLQQECDTNRELRQTVENEHKGLRNLVQVARNDATYWRRRYEEVCASSGTPVVSGLDRAPSPPPQAQPQVQPSGERAASETVAAESSGLTPKPSMDRTGATSRPREESQKRSEGFNVFKSIFGGQKSQHS